MILTNSLTQIVDEGAAKVANSLIRRMKVAEPSLTVVSCGAEDDGCDVHIPVNKLLLNGKLAALIHGRREHVLYVPSYARMLPTAIRALILSVYARRRLSVLLPMRSPMNRLARMLLRWSGAEIICLSADAEAFYRRELGGQVQYLRTGVDTARFVPVSSERKAELRSKYGIPGDKPVVLHVGHMSAGRNIGLMGQLSDAFHAVLVVSAQTEDSVLRATLAACPNLTLIDTYQPNIEEIYQLADAYLFPVEKALNCIDVPLSALESASCGVPVVTTAYGEMQQLLDAEGFYHLADTSPETVNALLRLAVQEKKNPRQAVLAYDWSGAVETLLRQHREKNA